MTISSSSTTVGSGGKSGPKTGIPRMSAGTSGTRQRKTVTSSNVSRGRTAANTGAMWRFYTDDSPGIKVGPVPVLVMSLLFIASVFLLHLWGKYTKA
ncbi:unnamed protein product [Gordionus sp. m RMFG-2023]|uniref:protein transport protein Sec61 subunit beta-like n=1 Tax=Gordionus sp. m RMFG-2023 TaxID=3053472 RepID=UPI0030DE6F96